MAICETAWRDKDKAPASLIFNAAVIRLDAAKREATFYIMNTSPNRNRWGVTTKALNEGAPTIKGKPIGSGKGYKTDDHYPDGETIDVGGFTSWAVPSSYMTATATIKDDVAWGKLQASEWGPISVVVDSYFGHCSRCGEELISEATAPWKNHEHITQAQGYMVVESFKFHRVDFVDNPAYPQAGILKAEADGDTSSVITLMAGYYQGLHSNGGAPGSSLDPEGIRKKMSTLEELKAELEEKATQIETLEAEAAKVKGLEAEVETLKAGQDPDEDPATKELKERLDKIEGERHLELVDACAEARFKVGLVTDLEQEKERLKAFSDPYLITLRGDAEVYGKKIKAAIPPRAPRAQYDEGEELTGFDAAFKASKERLFPKHVADRLMAQINGLVSE